MLTTQLRELEADGLIARKIYPQVPPKVEYSMAPLGQKLAPVLAALKDWGTLIFIYSSTIKPKINSSADKNVPVYRCTYPLISSSTPGSESNGPRRALPRQPSENPHRLVKIPGNGTVEAQKPVEAPAQREDATRSQAHAFLQGRPEKRQGIRPPGHFHPEEETAPGIGNRVPAGIGGRCSRAA